MLIVNLNVVVELGMIETYSHEFNWWQKILQKTLGLWRINKDSVDFKWGYFAPRFGLELMLHRGGYFDKQYAFSFCFIWGKFCIKLPFKTKLPEGCDMPRYGFCTFDNTIMFYGGGEYDETICQMCGTNCKVWDIPWISYEFEGHWILDKDYAWQEVGKKGLPDSWDFRETGAYKETHAYTYTLDSGEVQNRIATCTVEKRRWHRKWFPWIKMVRRVIDVEFDQEVGEQPGSWKGGVTGCGYDMLENETLVKCLRRMEKERKL